MTIINKNNNIPYLDGLRGTAILFVIIAHAGLGTIIPGRFGVTLFFFISGFLITKLLLLEINNTGHINLKKFYLRRFFRLYPALLSMVILSLVTVKIFGCSIAIHDITAALFYYTNYYISCYRGTVADCSTILDIIWSVSVEEHFYFFFPFLMWLFLASPGQKNRKRFIILLIILCITTFLTRTFIYVTHINDIDYVKGRNFFCTHTRMDSILWGCIASLLLFDRQNKYYLKILKSKKYFITGVILLLLSFIITYTPFRQTFTYTLQGLALLIIVPSLFIADDSWIKTTLENKILIFIGKISYSLYLFHWVALKIATVKANEYSLQWHIIFWPLAIIFSLSSYFFIEKSFSRLRKKFGSNVKEL